MNDKEFISALDNLEQLANAIPYEWPAELYMCCQRGIAATEAEREFMAAANPRMIKILVNELRMRMAEEDDAK